LVSISFSFRWERKEEKSAELLAKQNKSHPDLHSAGDCPPHSKPRRKGKREHTRTRTHKKEEQALNKLSDDIRTC